MRVCACVCVCGRVCARVLLLLGPVRVPAAAFLSLHRRPQTMERNREDSKEWLFNTEDGRVRLELDTKKLMKVCWLVGWLVAWCSLRPLGPDLLLLGAAADIRTAKEGRG